MFNTINSDNNEINFEEIIKKYRERLINISAKIVFNYEEAKDIVQESLLNLYKNKDLFLYKSSIYTYLYRIVINKSIDFLKKKNNKIKKEMLYIQKKQKEEIEIELKLMVEESLKKLPEKYRIPLILLEYEKLTYKEIANILNSSIENVKIIILRARKKLLKILTQKGVIL